MVAFNSMIAAVNDGRLCPTGKKMKTPSKGKRKIEIKPIEDQGKRKVTFSKRRAGLFKKADELSLLCGTQMAVVVESPAGKFFTFGHPDADLLIHRYLTGCKELDAEKKKKKKKGTIGGDYAAAGESADLGRGYWFDEAEDGFDDEKEIEEYMLALEDLKANLISRAEELNLLQETGATGADGDDNNNAAAAATATATATTAEEEEEDEWMNRLMAMMEEEGCDHLYGLVSDDWSIECLPL